MALLSSTLSKETCTRRSWTVQRVFADAKGKRAALYSHLELPSVTNWVLSAGSHTDETLLREIQLIHDFGFVAMVLPDR